MMNGELTRMRLVASTDVTRAKRGAGVCTLAQYLAFDGELDSQFGQAVFARLFEADGLYTAGEAAALLLAPIPGDGFAEIADLDAWMVAMLQVYRIGQLAGGIQV